MKLWAFDAGDGVANSPTIGPDGTLYFMNMSGRLLGALACRRQGDDGARCLQAYSTVAMSPDATVLYVAVGSVTAFDTGGHMLSSFPSSGERGRRVGGRRRHGRLRGRETAGSAPFSLGARGSGETRKADGA